MYSARFINDNGSSFEFSFQNSVIFDIDPLSELDVDLGTAQSYDQIGESVESQAVMGVTREIRGVLLGSANDKKHALLRAFAPRTHGQLIFNGRYIAECYIKKAPAISAREKDAGFSLMLFCPYPYWLHVDEVSESLNAFTPAFSFPVEYDEHVFGTRFNGGFIPVQNNGNAPAYFKIEFVATAAVTDYGILNVTTGEYIQLNDEISVDETVTVYRQDGRIYAEKTAAGTTESVLNSLDENSGFYTLAVGENILKLYADTNEGALGAVITFRNVFTGVYDGM